MALFIQQDENRTEFQKQLNTALQDKARKNSMTNSPDGVEDSEYIKNTKNTTSLAWVWVLIVVVAVGIAAWLMAISIDYK